jgi:hypothetical protein
MIERVKNIEIMKGYFSRLPVNGTIETRIGKLSFESGYPPAKTVQKLYDDMDFQRACRA